MSNVTLIALTPLFLMLGYIVYLLVKPKTRVDQFFELSRELTMDELLKRIEILEELNGAHYPGAKKNVRAFYADQKLSQRELDRLEDIITNKYFDDYKKRWISFQKADFVLKIILVLTILAGFYVFSFVVMSLNIVENKGLSIATGILIGIIMFPISFMCALIYLGVQTMVLTIVRFAFPSHGALFQANVIVEEFIKSFKPGGRNTPVNLPESDDMWI